MTTSDLPAGLLPRPPRREDDVCKECWYCGNALGPHHEHDHVLPQRHGGGPVAPACKSCHDLKDRTPLDKWPADVAFRALVACEQVDHARLLMAKFYAVALDMERDNAMRGVL